MNIKDVAKMAGVSISTISRVINNSAYVSPDIRERIEKVLADTGYRPNSLAKELLSHKTNTLGVMLPRIDLGTFSAIFDGISAVVTANGYNIILANTYDRKEEELRYLDLFHAKRVDGILYFATGSTTIIKGDLETEDAGGDRRTVEYSSNAQRCESTTSGPRTMVNHLAALGHRRIGCIAVGDHDENIGKLRREGYRAALEDSGISYDPELVVTGDFEYPSGRREPKTDGGRRKRPTAIYCITDRLAIGAIAWLTTHGYKVPEDISVACVDDPKFSRIATRR